MFVGKKYIIFIAKKKITLASVASAKNPVFKTLSTYDWTEGTLTQILLTIKKNVGSKLRMLLSEDFAYVVSLKVSIDDKKRERSIIAEKAQELIPEDLANMLWDYKEVRTGSIKEDSRLKLIQVIALTAEFNKLYSSVIAKSGLVIEAIEPISYALARLLEEDKDPNLIIQMQEKYSLIACQAGSIISIESFEAKPDQAKIKEFLHFLKDHFEIEIKQIIIASGLADQDFSKFKLEGVKIKSQELNPFIGLALKQDLQGYDDNVLNLTKESLKVNSRSDQNLTGFNRTKVLITLLAMSLVYLLSIFLILRNIPKQQVKDIKLNQSDKVTTALTEEDKASESADLDPSQFKIIILNGSNKVGEASKLRSALTDDGYIVSSIGNADSNNYTGITVRKSGGVTENFQQALDKVLQTLYTDVKFETLAGSEELDLIIIIGN